MMDASSSFTEESTIHGVNFIGQKKLHLAERFFWMVIVAGGTCGAMALAASNLNRFIANPTVVSLQKDYRNWNNPLPSATGCFINKTDRRLATRFIRSTWNVTPEEDGTRFAYYLKYVTAVANASYFAIDFAPFENDSTLDKVSMLDIATSVHPPLTGTLVTFDTKRKSAWNLMMTELGICYSVNIKFARTLSYKRRKSNESNVDRPSLLSCHFLNGLCYARYDSDPLLPLKIFVHSYLDVPHATMSQPLTLREREELDVNYIMQETSSSPSLRQLTPYQRKCRFDDEPLDAHFSVYSTSVCFMLCRYKLVMQRCGCRPFFYHKLSGKVCNITELACVKRYAAEVTRPPTEIGCKCPQQCEFVTYLPHSSKKTVWEAGYFDQRITFRWGLLHPTTKYRRDILFGFEDLVGSFGGSLALFLGISFISFVELFYFACERILRKKSG